MAALPVQFERRPLVVVMGVSGCGKSTIGVALAQHWDLPFLDADDYHPASNVDKMSKAIPLTDEDRWPWLQSLSQAMVAAADQAGGVVATCSALKRKYREYILQQVDRPLLFVFLEGDRETLFARMQQRSDHYMPPSLLDSQLADLERPHADEPAATFSVDKPVGELVEEIVGRLDARQQN
ncbi:MAG: gluconokinase [Gammaproteobacteria bacterium]|nr:gluconokinase [Gammaproteobacteria bacterium]